MNKVLLEKDQTSHTVFTYEVVLGFDVLARPLTGCVDAALDYAWSFFHDVLIIFEELFGNFFLVDSSIDQKQSFLDKAFVIPFCEVSFFLFCQLFQQDL